MADPFNYANADRDIEQVFVIEEMLNIDGLIEITSKLSFSDLFMRQSRELFRIQIIHNFDDKARGYYMQFRDVILALIALKKGAQLLKYGRKGKPKFCPFRLSSDESSLIWISSKGERSLKLSSNGIFVQKRITYHSLLYTTTGSDLDLICKDKVEAEAWISGLKALIASGQGGRSKIDGWSDGGLYLDCKIWRCNFKRTKTMLPLLSMHSENNTRFLKKRKCREKEALRQYGKRNWDIGTK
ncbi:hypothetical protein Csa_018948 [Cucumis sativus]|nr:hypothetical protein Csa_018948 [Cucumis sativus]